MTACMLLLLPVAIAGCGGEKEPREVEAPQVAEQPEAMPEKQAKNAPAVTAPEVAPRQAVPEVAEKKVEPVPAKPVTPKAEITGPFVLEDLSQVKVHKGCDSPKVGDTIYTFETVPLKVCGEYWVIESNGYVAMLSVCPGDHAH